MSRLATLCYRGNYGGYDGLTVPTDPDGYHEALSGHEFDRALKTLWTVVTHINQDINREQPWKALKDGNFPLLRTQLTEWLAELHVVGYWLAPLLPATNEEIISLLSSCTIRT